MFENDPLKVYYQNHPNATIKDYLDYLDTKKKEDFEKENNRNDLKIQWYKDLAGRFFILKFNERVYMVIYVDKYPSTEFKTKYTVYSINVEHNTIVKEDNREINRHWFKNPYEKPYWGQNEGECIEITKEVYKDIVNKYNICHDFVKSIDIKNIR